MNAVSISPTELRTTLFRNGYHPVPVSDPNPTLSSGGKAPLFKDWRQTALAADEMTIAAWSGKHRNHGNTGLLTGSLVGLDLDVPVPALAAKIEALADALLPPTPLHRIGKAPKSLRCYRATIPLAKMETAELILEDGSTVQVEAMGAGQQVVGFGVHPGTGQPYTWSKASPLMVPLSDLPEVTEDVLRGFLAAAEAILRAAGGRTRPEREKAAEPPREAPPPEQPAASTRTRGKTGDVFSLR